MGFFNSYTKEGKGVDKDIPKPIRPLYFFEIFFRKIAKMFPLNMLYIVLTLPIWIALYLIMTVVNSQLATSQEGIIPLLGQSLTMFSYVFILFAVLTGPATAGITYIFKSFATETPIFIYSDFFEHYKKNFKQSFLMMLINGFFMLSFSLTLYQPGLELLQIPSFVFLILLIFSNYYAFSIMVMFKMKFLDILKNSFLLALAKLPLNLLVLILTVVIVGGLFTTYPVIGGILSFLILYSFCGFLTVFSVYPTIEKLMLIPASEETNKNDDALGEVK
jgi:uncharacterized membrane protein YesL